MARRTQIMTPAQREHVVITLGKMVERTDADRIVAGFVQYRLSQIPYTLDDAGRAACVPAVVKAALADLARAASELREEIRGILS